MVAEGFVLLLQMTAVPYITLSLITGIGGLSAGAARQGLKVSLLVIFLLTILMLAFIFLTPIAYPQWQHASFYSASTIKVANQIDWLSAFIPANPFNALSNAVIPAVVVFSIFVGVGLMPVSGKSKTLRVLNDLLTAIYNVNSYVMKVAPIGVLCIAFRAVNTLLPSDLDGLLVYLLSSITVVLFLSLLLLPAVVSIVTPIGYRDTVKGFREALLTAFATGSFLIVIPVITEKIKTLLTQLRSTDNQVNQIPKITVPITFSLPVGGKLLGLLFVAFASWFSGIDMSVADFLSLAVLGLPQLFATPAVAMPALLEIFNLPISMFDLFLLSDNLLVGRLNAALSVVFASCFTILIATTLAKKISINWRKLGLTLLGVFVFGAGILLILRFSLESISHQYNGYEAFIDRDLVRFERPFTNVKSPNPNEVELFPTLSVLQRIKKRGVLRVGYFRDDLPYAFHNKSGKLVGFDIEIIHMLAQDLRVDVEFVRIFRKEAAEFLSTGYLDLTTGVPVLPDNMRTYTLSMPYGEQSLAIVVKKERRAEFIYWRDIVENTSSILSIPETFFYRDAITRNHFKGKVWEISTPRLFFKEEYQHIDAMLFGAASASAWTLLYPDYVVVRPAPVVPELAMAFPLNDNDAEFELFMGNWIQMKTRDKNLEILFRYWIEGEPVHSFLQTQKTE